MEVVALSRRDRVHLAAVVAPPAEEGGSFLVRAEDGAEFRMDGRGVVARFTGLGDPPPGIDVPAWLRDLRRDAGPSPDWLALRESLEDRAEFDLDDLFTRCGCQNDAERLAAAIGLREAAPWFRRKGARVTAVPIEEAKRHLAQAEAAQRAAAEDAALLEWWPRRADTPRPSGVAGALKAMSTFALAGPGTRTERGRKLAGRLDLPEADQALEALVAAGQLPPEINPAPHRAGLADPFPAPVRAETLTYAEAPLPVAGRVDLRALYTVAIDDASTVEVDDALSYRHGPDGPELLVHIADVSAAFPRGSALDRIAAERASSLYLPEVTVPMLPLALVQQALSLDAGEDRAAVTGIFRIDVEGRTTGYEFVRSVVSVDRALTYGQCDDIAALGGDEETGRALLELAARLRRRRTEDGAIFLDLDSLKVLVQGAVPSIGQRIRGVADQLVAECMVLYNRHVGDALAQAGAGGIFRMQDAPRMALPAADDPLCGVRSRRALAGAHTMSRPGRHHGLGVDRYAQATSPIRRYGDLVNQRQFGALIDGHAPALGEADLERLAEHLSGRERAVRAASRLREAYWLARVFEPQVGETLQGILSRAPRRGLGSVWVPPLCRELPLRAPRGWKAPETGTEATFRIGRVLPYRGRIELEPAGDDEPGQ